MNSWTNFSAKVVSILWAICVSLSGCAPTTAPTIAVADNSAAVEKSLLIAVLPLDNLSGTPAPLGKIRQSLIDALKESGLSFVDQDSMVRFIAKNRLRYTGGVTRTTAVDLKWQTGAEAVLITSVELYSEDPPPKISLTARLVSTGNNPEILWMDGVGLAGDDSIGILELSVIDDPNILLKKAVRYLSTSLRDYFSGGKAGGHTPNGRIKFWPKLFFTSPILDLGTKYKVAVVPFFDESQRRFGGEIMANHFARQLRTLENFTVIEPGEVREALLQMRIIMEDGISFADARALFTKLDADLILAGKVFAYQDYIGVAGKPVVDFSALLIEQKSQEVVWACESFNEGDDGVYFFDWGKVNTAHAMASEMVQTAMETIGE